MTIDPVELAEVLLEHGLTTAALAQQASQVVLFGSRAAGAASPRSDWDLLCVGDGRSIHRNRLDLIWVSEECLATPRWLGSELATHVAAHGRWLVGEDTWSRRAFVSRLAVRFKREAVLRQLQELRRLWPHLLPSRQARQARRLRREVQRLACLAGGRAVPPSPFLDQDWNLCGQPVEDPELLDREVLAGTPSSIRKNIPPQRDLPLSSQAPETAILSDY